MLILMIFVKIHRIVFKVLILDFLFHSSTFFTYFLDPSKLNEIFSLDQKKSPKFSHFKNRGPITFRVTLYSSLYSTCTFQFSIDIDPHPTPYLPFHGSEPH
jgi:hypothetical protein